MLKSKYSTKEVCDILWLQRSNIQYYLSHNIIKVEDRNQPKKGAGSQRYFTPRNIVEIAVSRYLANLGVSIRTLPVLIDEIMNLVEVENRAESKIIGTRVDFLDPNDSEVLGSKIMILSLKFASYKDSIKTPVINETKVVRLIPGQDDAIIDVDMEFSASELWLNLSFIMHEIRALIIKHDG